MAIKINSNNNSNVQNLLAKYQIWQDYQQGYHAKSYESILDDPDGIPCFHYRDIIGIKSCQSRDIVIDNLIEGIHSLPYFDHYPRHDRRYYLLSGGDWDQKVYLLPFTYTNTNCFWWLMEMTDTYLSPNRFCFYLDKQYQFGEKKLDFVCLTGHKKHTRDRLQSRLSQLIFDTFVFRYNAQNFGHDLNYLDPINFCDNEYQPHRLTVSGTGWIDKYHHSIDQSLPINLLNQAYLNLIIESYQDLNDSFFLTEKTIKALITGMPFVIYATPKFLNRLHQLGFCTYGDLWNEDYDQINDLDQRVTAIIDLLNQLHTFDWIKHQDQLDRISKHNRANFFALGGLQSAVFKNLLENLKGISTRPNA